MVIYPFKDLGKANYGWLETSYHFSFANYYNMNKVHLGPLRVINDDIISPKTGFDTHPHNDMEILTYIVSGTLTHQDSMGNKRELGPHGIQYMSAGSGVTHSEHNMGDEPLHLYQIWIFPREKHLTPNYGDMTFKPKDFHNRFYEVVSGDVSTPIQIYQHASISIGMFDENQTVEFDMTGYKEYYNVLIDGEIEVNGLTVRKGDAFSSEETTTIRIVKPAHILAIKV